MIFLLFPKLQILFWLFMFLISSSHFNMFNHNDNFASLKDKVKCSKIYCSTVRKCTFLITKKIGHLKCNSVCNILGRCTLDVSCNVCTAVHPYPLKFVYI